MTKKFAKALFHEFKTDVSHLDVKVTFVSYCRGRYEIVISSDTGFISSPVFALINNFLHYMSYGWYGVSISRDGKLHLDLS